MITDTILALAQLVNPSVEKKNISELDGGFSSIAYRVNAEASDFVLLTHRPGAVDQPKYGHAYVVLTLLERHHIAHAPEALWLKEDHTAMVLSYYDGIASDSFNFLQAGVDPEQIAIKVIDNLLDAASITYDEYRALAEEMRVEPSPITTPKDTAAKYGTDWFKIIKQSCPDQNIIDWLEPRVAQSVAMADKIGQNQPSFGHGDPSNPNILLRNDGSFMLIDWDSAGFHTTGPEFYLAYTTHLTDFMKPYRQILIEHVAKRLGLHTSEFSKRVHDFRRYSEIFDINWAAMMMAKINCGEVAGDINKFREIALERIDVYKKSFEN